MSRLIIEGTIEVEGHGWLLVNQATSSDFLASLLVKYFSPGSLLSKYDRDMLASQKILSMQGLPFDSPERRRIVEEIEQLSEDYSNSFRMTFEPLANQGKGLSLKGDLIVEGAELSFQSSSQNGFLGSILLEQFQPDLPTAVDEDLENDTSINLGAFRIIFEKFTRRPDVE